MPDGCRLAARIWLPVDAEKEPVPALLEYEPYRKNEWTALKDSTRHPYFAGHGYASIRVDLRGCGDSDGIPLRSYRLLKNGMENDQWNRDTLSIVDGDPLSAQARCEWFIIMGREDWRTRVETLSTMSADAKAFHVTNVLDAYEGNTRVFTKTEPLTIPRDLV